MSTELIDFDSIEQIFKARDKRNAENAQIRRRTTEAPAERTSRTGSSSAAKQYHSTTKGGRRLETPRRTRLEDMPERDEYRKSNKSGAHHSSGNNGIGHTLATLAAGVGAVLYILFNVSSPAMAPNGDDAKADSTPSDKPSSAAHYYTQQSDDGDIITVGDKQYSVQYNDVSGTDAAEDRVEAPSETPKAPEASEAPYVPIEHVSDNLIDAMKGFEGLFLEAYVCPGGSWTIGYGHTAGVYEGQTITEEEAKALLREDLASREDHVRRYAEKAGVRLTQGQFDALVDFAYNLGTGCFDESGLAEMIGKGDLDGAAAHMQEYVYTKDKNGNKVKLGGLVTRRAAEAEWLYS